jgi:hypothetical protein
MGPIGKFLLLATLIALIIDDFETWRAGGKSVIGDLVKALDTLLGVDVTGWVTAMVDFFEDGWQAIKAGAGAIFQTIFALVKFLINVWEDPKKAWHDFIWELRLIWDELWDYVEGDGAAIVDAFMNTFIAPVGELFKMLTTDIKGFFNELFEDIVLWAERTTQAVLSPFVKAKEFLGGLLGTDSVVKVKGVLDNSNLQAAGSVARTGAGARTQERVRARIGAGAAGGGIMDNSRIEVNTTINPAAGMSEESIGRMVDRRVSKQLDKRNRNLTKAFTPVGAGG